MPSEIKAVFFDCNSTLHDDTEERFFASVQRTCERFANRLAIDPARLKDAYLARNHDLHLLAAGPRDERPVRWIEMNASIWASTLAACGLAGAVDPAALAATLLQERLQGLKIFPEVPRVIQQLAGRYTVGLISNGQGDMQRAILSTLGLESYFKPVLISGEVGFGKPSVEIFVEAAHQAGVPPTLAAHIGDNLAADVAGANQAGMLAIWLNRERRSPEPQESQPDHTVASLEEVGALLLV